jgi:hypothetical protein
VPNKLEENLQRLTNFARASYPQKLECRLCNNVYTDKDEVEYISELGICYNCDSNRTEAQYEAMWEAREDMKELGLNPDNEDDRSKYFERDY